jgi:hypothetical protein
MKKVSRNRALSAGGLGRERRRIPPASNSFFEALAIADTGGRLVDVYAGGCESCWTGGRLPRDAPDDHPCERNQ